MRILKREIYPPRNVLGEFYFMKIIALTIAGSDPSGGAGIQQDIKVFSRLGIFSCAVITAITVQNTTGVKNVFPLKGELVGEELSFLLEDIIPHAIKIGMLSTREIVEEVSLNLKRIPDCPVVADPVMLSKNKRILLEKEAISEYVKKLFPLIHVLTPNIHEASMLSKKSIKNIEDMIEAGKIILDMLQKERISSLSPVVLIKGGHLENNEEMVDVAVTQDETFFFGAKRIKNIHTHGTGCTLSSAICAFLAQGDDIKSSLKKAKRFVTNAIKSGFPLGKGIGPVNPLESWFNEHLQKLEFNG